ncbi:hypothetical protein GTP10_00015 [Lactiplantibacillus plantarum]|uniref:hypothetical protein n=1 Tax=Lactiplantibacillus plantarum TaxID=1590 RepID=UPI001AAF0A72|nr:hypothetical protein [Lactiplantibacillus plantarum]MBO2714563.1 hypothetical protein [Lactiplantibacillus plantarum]
MNEEDKRKKQQRLPIKKFEDFIQGIYDTNKEPSNEDWLDNVASAMVPNEAIKRRDNEKCSEFITIIRTIKMVSSRTTR